MAAHHDLHIVVLSIIVSVIAAYASRDLSSRVSEAPHDSVWAMWVCALATVDAIGIWSMHYTGELALHLPVPLRLDWRIAFLSLLVAFVGCVSSAMMLRPGPIGWPRALIISILLGGVSISGLHYSSTAAIKVPTEHHYSLPGLVLPVLLSIGLSFAAVWLAFGSPPRKSERHLPYHASAIIRGLTNPAMHYTAMAGLTFSQPGPIPDLEHDVGILPLGMLAIVISPVTVVVVSLLTTVLDRVQRHGVLLDELFDQSPLPVALLTLDDKVVRVNREFTSLFGYTQQEAEGRPLRELLVPDALHGQSEEFVELIAHGKRVDLESVRRRRDGTMVDVSIIGVPVALPGGETQVYAIYRDLTERKQTEEQTRQAQKLESVGRLAGGIAHDFNNLLTVITGYSEMLLEQIDAAHPAREAVEEISKAAARASSLTQRLLLFTRRQASGREPVVLNDLVRNLEKMLGRLLGEDIELSLSLGADPGVIQANPGELEQVLMNLAVNSRDAMPEGGRLVVETANVWLDEQFARMHVDLPPGPYVQLTISDSGQGMPPEVKARIFEPFFTTKPPGKGTGLGLPTVYGIVKKYGGSIMVYSEPGKGTTFRFFFPAAAAVGVPAQPPPARQDLSGTETILVVEDEEGVRKYIHDILTRQGYRTLEARNGREALETARQYQGRIDLLLTDVVMPEMGGLDLATQFASERTGVPVLFMSGYSDRLWRQDMLTQSIQKPFASATLLTRIREILTTA